MDFPGGSVPFSRSPAWVGGAFSPRAPLPCYRTLDASGREVPGAAVPHPLSREVRSALISGVYGTGVHRERLRKVSHLSRGTPARQLASLTALLELDLNGRWR